LVPTNKIQETRKREKEKKKKREKEKKRKRENERTIYKKLIDLIMLI